MLSINQQHRIFIDKSVHAGDIPDHLDDQIIRDDYLRDSTVTILLVGTETKCRKHVDCEVYSSMIDGTFNKKSGILVVNLPPTGCELGTAAHGSRGKTRVYPDVLNWTTVDTYAGFHRRYPFMPDRIIDNLLATDARISVVPWTKATDPDNLRFLIDTTFDDRDQCKYDLHRDMRRRNSQ